MKNEAKDAKSPETCKNKHKYQYIEADKKGEIWQYCCDCDQELRVR